MNATTLRSGWHKLNPGTRRAIRVGTGVLVGATLGFSYYAMIGCSTGGCPITSDPVVSTLWGAMIGGFAIGS